MKSLLRLPVLAGSLALGLVSTLSAQRNGPAASPHQTVTQIVGTTAVSVDYSRPGVKGREVFGGLVPFDKIWRTGANASTKLKLAGPATIGGVDVPAGEYALYTIPGEDEWTIILSKDTSLWGAGGYDAANDLGRFTVEPTELDDVVETFTIDFEKFDGYTAHMFLAWDETKVAFPIKTQPAAE